MQNGTGFPDLDQFDSSIPADARQVLDTASEYGVTASSTFAELLDDRDVITDRTDLQKRVLRLTLVNAARDGNDYHENHVVSGASYLYSRADNVAIIGSVSVQERFRTLGVGTRMKKHIDNHARQDGATVSYTWIASDGGQSLAEKTRYRPETDVFADVEEIWVRQYDR